MCFLPREAPVTIMVFAAILSLVLVSQELENTAAPSFEPLRFGGLFEVSCG